MHKIFIKIPAIFFTFANLALASPLPDEYYERLKDVKSKESFFFDFMSDYDDPHPSRFNSLTYGDIGKVLHDFKITEPLEPQESRGGSSIVLYTHSYAIRLPKDISQKSLDFAKRETEKLLWVKSWTKDKPPYGVSLCLPKVFIALRKTCFNAYMKTFHISISERLKPVANFEEEINYYIDHGTDRGKEILSSFGYRIGQNQANYSIEFDGNSKRTAIHGDLNPKNIFLTKLPSENNRAEFTLIDNADFKRGVDANPGHFVTDPVYFTNIFVLWKCRQLSVRIKKHQLQNIESALFYFYQAYLIELDNSTRFLVRDYFLERKHLTVTEEQLGNLNRVIFRDSESLEKKYFYEMFNPLEERAVGQAFQAHSIPLQMPNKEVKENKKQTMIKKKQKKVSFNF